MGVMSVPLVSSIVVVEGAEQHSFGCGIHSLAKATLCLVETGTFRLVPFLWYSNNRIPKCGIWENL